MNEFSFVVPIFNIEKCLARCVTSLVNQNYDSNKIEILLIDDGSQDNSGTMCDEYSKQYSNVFTFHKINGGLSDARNYGLEKATKDYIIFLDSDDYISLDTCKMFDEILKKYNKNIDVIIGGVVKHINKREEIWNTYHLPTKLLTGQEFLRDRLSIGKWYVSAWSSIYNREFLLKNNLFFKKGILHEDEEFSPRVFLKANTVICLNDIFYHYVIRDDSITTTKNKIKNAKDIFEICRELDLIYQNIEDIQLKSLLMAHSAKICFKVIEDAKLYLKENRHFIDTKIVIKNSIFFKEKARCILLKINPYLLHIIKI